MVYRHPEINHTQDELESALKAVAEFACDKFILDCTNGMTLRDEQGVAITSGYNRVADVLMERKRGQR